MRKERPCAILPTLGGQTGLNTALALAKSGVLAECGTELIGARAEVIEKAESRELFRQAMENIGLKVPQSAIATIWTTCAASVPPCPSDDHPPRLYARRHGRRHRLTIWKTLRKSRVTA